MDVNVINERDINSTDASRLVHNRFPSVRYRKNRSGKYKSVDYNDTCDNLGIHNASLTSLFKLKGICTAANRAIERYNENPEEAFYLHLSPCHGSASLKAAQKAGIITGTPAKKEHIVKKYVNTDDPSDVIRIDKWEREKAEYYVRLDVNYEEIIEELNKFIKCTLEAYSK